MDVRTLQLGWCPAYSANLVYLLILLPLILIVIVNLLAIIKPALITKPMFFCRFLQQSSWLKGAQWLNSEIKRLCWPTQVVIFVLSRLLHLHITGYRHVRVWLHRTSDCSFNTYSHVFTLICKRVRAFRGVVFFSSVDTWTTSLPDVSRKKD